MLYEMRLVGLAMDPFNNSPIVILKDKASVEREEFEEEFSGEASASEEQGVLVKNDTVFVEQEPSAALSRDTTPDPLLALADEDRELFFDKDAEGAAAEHVHDEMLHEQGGEHILPIWIGEAEANAIATELLGILPPRPMTHDLVRQMIAALGARVVRVLITDLRDNTFYASIEIQPENGEMIALDARPSDALALALRFKAPIFVDAKVLAQTKPSEKDESEQELEVHGGDGEPSESDKWEDMLELLSAHSMGKYEQ